MNPLISVRARFERFPATLKGAFIVRGEDPDPHQVVLRGARAVPVQGGDGHAVPIVRTTLDIAPKRDVFVPFEMAVSELDPGWYELECELEVDGIIASYPGGRRFSVAWPRATTRRGSVPVGKEVRLGPDVRVRVDQLESVVDQTRVQLRVTPPSEIVVSLVADGRRVPILDLERDERSGRARVSAYPLLKTDRTVRIELRAGRASETLEVRLP